nr:MAG TPA: hypothetical protein [Herelleviridae sp.]
MVTVTAGAGSSGSGCCYPHITYAAPDEYI